MYDFWASTMVVPFVVALFWYHPSRVYAVVASMIVGLVATVVWGFALGSPWDVGPALFGFVAAVAALFVVLPLISRLPLSRIFQPAQQSALDSEEISWFP